MNNDSEDRHILHCENIAKNPNLIGLDGIVMSSFNNFIFDEGKIVSRPDILLFKPSVNKIYVVQFKGNFSEEKVRNNIRDIKYYLSNSFKNTDIEYLFMCRDYIIK